ncbi:MAG: STAS domain-containing protein [Vicinamibacterales bacterium]
MDISSRFVAGVTVLHLEGRLIMQSRGGVSLRAVVSDLVEKGRVVVLVHMAGVTDMDAHGIGALVSSLTTLERQGGRMALIAPSSHVRRLLAMTRLDSVFSIYESEPEAFARNRSMAAPTPSWDPHAWARRVVLLDGST